MNTLEITLILFFIYPLGITESNVTYLSNSTLNNIIYKYVKLNETNSTWLRDSNSNETLDGAMFEINDLPKYVQIAEKKNEMFQEELNRTLLRYHRDKKYEAFQIENEHFSKIALDLMKQSIYATRERLQDTREVRKEFADDVAYKQAVTYGMLLQLRVKQDNIYSTMRSLSSSFHFIHVLTLYERLVVASVDIDVLVDQMFQLQEEYTHNQNPDAMDIRSKMYAPGL